LLDRCHLFCAGDPTLSAETRFEQQRPAWALEPIPGISAHNGQARPL